jgi:hypothetical protein
VPKKAWQGFRANVEEIELHKLKLKLKEQIQPRWQTSGEELFDAIGRIPDTVVFMLDEFAVMIDGMAHLDAHREDARLLLRWLRLCANRHALRTCGFWWPDRSALGMC